MSVTVRFLPHESGVTPITLAGRVGQSLLEIALAGGVRIDHACGGQCACSTCHVWVKEGMIHLSEAEDKEMDQLEQAPDNRPTSRLACQARIIHPDAVIACEIPAWNRNLASEG